MTKPATRCPHRNAHVVDPDGAGEDFRFCNDCGENFTLSTQCVPEIPASTLDFERQILTLVESSIEDTRVPDAIAAHADKRAGKPVTKTDAEQLEVRLGIRFRVTRRHGMTRIAWATGKGQNPWSEGCSILLAHADTNVLWPTGDDLRKKEPVYFRALDERNVARRQLLTEHHLLDRIPAVNPSVIERAAAAIAKLREARAELKKLTDFDEPLHVVSCAIEKLAKDES